MPTAKVMFAIPENALPLADVVYELGGVLEDDDDLMVYLAANPGTVTSIVFEDSNDPIADVAAVTDLLKAAGSRYFAVTDSYTEPSRNTRFSAYVFLNLLGTHAGEKSAKFPWENGEPDINEQTLEEAGFADADVKAMTEIFFPDSPRPVHSGAR